MGKSNKRLKTFRNPLAQKLKVVVAGSVNQYQGVFPLYPRSNPYCKTLVIRIDVSSPFQSFQNLINFKTLSRKNKLKTAQVPHAYNDAFKIQLAVNQKASRSQERYGDKTSQVIRTSRGDPCRRWVGNKRSKTMIILINQYNV